MECEAEHSAAIAGGRFVKAGAMSNIMQLAGRWRTANYAEREECRVDLENAVNAQSAEITDLRTALAEREARMKRIEQYGVEWQNQALNLRTAAQQALEAMKGNTGSTYSWYKAMEAAITTLTTALESKT